MEERGSETSRVDIHIVTHLLQGPNNYRIRVSSVTTSSMHNIKLKLHVHVDACSIP